MNLLDYMGDAVASIVAFQGNSPDNRTRTANYTGPFIETTATYKEASNAVDSLE